MIDDDKVATDDTVNNKDGRNHSYNVRDQPSANGEPHSIGKMKK